MSENGVEARLVGACEAFRPTNRTRLIKMRAVRNPVCNTPKASSANAVKELSERTRKLRDDPEPRDHGSKGYQSDARHGTELWVADNTSPCEARQDETSQESVWTITQRPGVGVHRIEPLQRATEG